MGVKDPLQKIPHVGPRTATVLRELGVQQVSDLVGRDPLLLYERLCVMDGGYVDRCVLYVFRCAVYFATEPEPDPDLLDWWKWKGREELVGSGR